MCRSVFEPSARALLTDVTPEERRMSVFNARYYAINLGGAIGPLVGLSLGASKNPLPFLISAGVYLCTRSLFFTGLSATNQTRTRRRKLIMSP